MTGLRSRRVPEGGNRGAELGEPFGLRRVFEDAGFSTFRRAAETPLNLILEAKR
jgi:hypothetical protein